MIGSGPRQERETIINFNEENAEASIWTASTIVYKQLLKRLGSDYLTEDGERHAIFSFPKKFLLLPRKREKKQLNPEQKAKSQLLIARANEFRRKAT
jgi:hypothetical protein